MLAYNMQFGAYLVAWRDRLELWTLATIVFVTGGVWVFVELADEVMEGESQAIDRAILLAFRNARDISDPIGPGWVEELGRDLTALGGVAVLTLLTLAVAGYLWLIRKTWLMWLMFGAIGGGLGFSTILKHAFDRARPDLVPHDSVVYSASFPSGHSMLAAITYLTLAALLAEIQTRRALKSYFIGIAVLLTLSVGLSRVYLGVHWPSDVLAGWAVGASWALLFWLLLRWLSSRSETSDC